MTRVLYIFVLLGALAAHPALADSVPVSIAGFASDGAALQYGYDEGYGGGGGGTSASNRNMRISFFFIAVPVQSDDVFDSSSGSSPSWTDYWGTGLGGGIEFSYHMAPAFRFGIGSGYHIFPGKEDDLGWATATYDGMSCIPIRVEAVVCFPFSIPSGAWFKTGKSFVPGPVPYLGVELAGVYRTAVEVEYSSGGFSTDLEMFAGSFAFFLGARLGFEFRGPNYGVFLDFGYRLYLPPGDGDDLGSGVDILNMQAFPIRIGVAIYFGAGAAGGSYY